METTWHRFFKAAVAAVALVAMAHLSCSMTRPLEMPPEEDDIYEVESAMVEVYRALCGYWERCVPEKLSYFPGNSVSACVAYYECLSVRPDEPVTRYTSRPPLASVENPAACREHIESRPCDPSLASVTPNVVGIGLPEGSSVVSISLDQVAAACGRSRPREGEHCLLDGSGCSTGLFCEAAGRGRLAGDSLCGVCTAKKTVGTTCDGGVPCQTGAFCEAGMCVNRRATGSACEAPGQCTTGICLEGVCRDIGAPGDICGDGFHCLSGYCEEGVCSGSPRPEELFRGDIGEPCESIFSCRLGLSCHERACRTAPCVASRGEACVFEYPHGCESGSYCDSGNRTCDPLKAEGDPCPLAACREGLACRFQEETHRYQCVPGAADGAPCSDNGDCENNHCYRNDYSLYCEPGPPNFTECDAPPCDDCGVCGPVPDVDDCIWVDTL